MGLFGGGDYLGHRGVAAAQSAIAALNALASDGADGDVIITGGTTTLARDMYYNNLSITGTGVLVARGWRIFFRTLTIDVGGILHCNGLAASGTAAGAAYAAGSLQNNSVGVAGGTGVGAAGTNAGSCNLPRSGTLGSVFRGGAGGSGTSGAGGAAGTVALPTLGRILRSDPFTGSAHNNNSFGTPTPASSGGAGAGDGVNSGGGSGSSGGFGWMMGGSVVNNGAIQAQGGAGGTPPSGNCGGGGPGGGGYWSITCGTYTGNLPDVSAGAPGAGVGTGTAGAAGVAGDYFISQYKSA